MKKFKVKEFLSFWATCTFSFFKKKEKGRGQVSVEVLASVIILLLLLVLVFALNVSRDANTELLEERINGEIECNKIAGILSQVNTSAGNAEVFFTAEEDFGLNENRVVLEHWECRFYGNMSEINLSAGEVKVAKNSTGLVVENV